MLVLWVYDVMENSLLKRGKRLKFDLLRPV